MMRCSVLVFWDTMIFCTKFMLPKRRFWKAEQPFRVRFRITFQGFEYCIRATKGWKVLRKRTRKGWFGLRNLRLGRVKFARWYKRSCKVVTKDHSIPENQHISSHVATSFVIILQSCKIVASQKNQRIASHVATIFESSCKSFYAPQAKILDDRTNVWERIFEVLFKGWVLDLGDVPLKVLRKCVPKRSFGHPKSSLGEHKVVTKDHNIPETNISQSQLLLSFLHLTNFTLPKRRFWKAEQTFQSAFSKHF